MTERGGKGSTRRRPVDHESGQGQIWASPSENGSRRQSSPYHVPRPATWKSCQRRWSPYESYRGVGGGRQRHATRAAGVLPPGSGAWNSGSERAISGGRFSCVFFPSRSRTELRMCYGWATIQIRLCFVPVVEKKSLTIDADVHASATDPSLIVYHHPTQIAFPQSIHYRSVQGDNDKVHPRATVRFRTKKPLCRSRRALSGDTSIRL